MRWVQPACWHAGKAPGPNRRRPCPLQQGAGSSLGHRLGLDGLEHDDLAAFLVGNRCKHPLAGLATKRVAFQFKSWRVSAVMKHHLGLGLQIRLSGLNERLCFRARVLIRCVLSGAALEKGLGLARLLPGGRLAVLRLLGLRTRSSLGWAAS